jgi:HAE1 family hydrophobic/amphiphilic exporter-1
LYRSSAKLEEALRGIPIIQDVNSDMQLNNPQINIGLKREAASSYGVSASKIEDTLYYAYGTRQVSTIYASDNQYQVILEVAPQYQMNPAALSMLYVRSASGKLVPLKEVADVKVGVGPLQVNHLGQMPAVTISFNLKPGVSLSQAVEAINAISTTVLPQDITTSFQGAAQAFQSSFKGMWLIILLAIIIIYIVLGILYESFFHPITILSGLPSAGFGAVLTLMIFHKELNVYSLVGVIMLVGIVKKNAIMMVDFALGAQKNSGVGPEEAIFQGAIIRFRPIMMTTMAALMGTLPIALGVGAGSESRRPLGLAVVGGLVFSQLLTLYITPVIFVYLDRLQKRFSGKKPEASREPEPLAE